MALVLKDRVKETCTSPGTGTVTLLGASTGYVSFSVIGNGNTTYYTIADQTGNNWEVGIGIYTSSGTTLTRDTVLSNSLGTTARIDFSSGTQDVFVTYPSGRSVYADGTTLTATNSSVLPVASGGTGLTSTPANGALDIGNGTGFTRTTLTAGSGISITNGSGSISIASSGGGGFSAMQTFTSSGTFTVPSGKTTVKVTVIGGGQGGYSAYNVYSCPIYVVGGASGGGGGTAVEYITGLTPGGTVSVTVGAGGAGAAWTGDSTPGATGGTSSFGAYCSATGGSGGGGLGSGGNLNLYGGGAGSGSTSISPYSGSSGYGIGGAGAYNCTVPGFTGKAGIVIVEY
jgi:hypothetical protein